MQCGDDARAGMWAARDVAAYLNVSVRTVWRLAKEPGFPKPVRYGLRVTRWRADDLAAYVARAEVAE
jgi:predicted DNA-binding transcriptional regulator AlpA